MQKSNFNIRIAAGRVIPVSGYVWRFGGFRVGAYKGDRVWYVCDLSSGCLIVAVSRLKDADPALMDLWHLDRLECVRRSIKCYPNTNPGLDPRSVTLSAVWDRVCSHA